MYSPVGIIYYSSPFIWKFCYANFIQIFGFIIKLIVLFVVSKLLKFLPSKFFVLIEKGENLLENLINVE